jgi:alpha-beta hydrolase superfamily lysophospholipase
LKVVAESLSRAGHHVLRFDYRGLGDSSGDSADGGRAPWCEDVLQALEELEALSGVKEVRIVGLRLGAALAVTAIGSRRRRPGHPTVSHLVLWDPVLSGSEFLSLATRMMSEFLNDPGRFPAAARDGVSREPADALLGYSYPDALRRSLGEIDIGALDPWPPISTSIVLSAPSPTCSDLAERLRAAGRQVLCELIPGADASWADYRRHEKALRAGRLGQFLLERLGSVPE